MAIQAQAYQDNLSGFPACGNPHGGVVGGGFVMENGYGNGGVDGCLSENLNWHQQQQFLLQQMQQQQRNQDSILEMGSGRRMSGNKRSVHVMYQPQPNLLLDQNAFQIQQLIRLQNEKLRMVMQQQTMALVNRVESKTRMLIAQKDQQIAQASEKTVELHNLLSQLEMERLAWQQMAEENEATVASLTNTLDELKRDRVCSTSGQVDSCVGIENAGVLPSYDQLEVVGENAAPPALAPCRGCGLRQGNVLILPCRHLCVCGPCSGIIVSCPVCNSMKKSTIVALVS